MNLYEDLKWRGLIKDITNSELEDKLNNEKITFYIGTLTDAERAEVDEFQSYGYKVIADVKKTRNASSLTYDDMKKAAKGKPYEKELLKMISEKTNYMKVKKFFNENNK